MATFPRKRRNHQLFRTSRRASFPFDGTREMYPYKSKGSSKCCERLGLNIPSGKTDTFGTSSLVLVPLWMSTFSFQGVHDRHLEGLTVSLESESRPEQHCWTVEAVKALNGVELLSSGAPRCPIQILHHYLRFLWPHASHDRLCHSCDASEVSDMQSRIAVSKEVLRNCAPTPLAPATSDCADVFGLSGLPAEVAIILYKIADMLAIRTKTQGRTCNAKPLLQENPAHTRPCRCRQKKRNAWTAEKILHGSPLFPKERHKLQGRSACSNCRRTRSRHTIMQSHKINEYNCRARCSLHHDIMQLRKVTAATPCVAVAAMSPTERPSTPVELPPKGSVVLRRQRCPPSTMELRPLHSVHPQ